MNPGRQLKENIKMDTKESTAIEINDQNEKPALPLKRKGIKYSGIIKILTDQPQKDDLTHRRRGCLWK